MSNFLGSVHLLLLTACAVLLLLFSQMGNGEETGTGEQPPVAAGTEDALDAVTAALEDSLAQIDGVGTVSAEIMWQSTVSREYAYDEEESVRYGTEGATEERTLRREMVLLDGDGSPVVETELLPPVAGVLIVAEGAYKPEVREELIAATAIFLDVGAHKISVSRRRSGE